MCSCMKQLIRKPAYLYAELIVLMVGLPMLLALVIPLRYMLPTLWIAALYCHLIYRHVVDLPERVYWRWQRVCWAELRPMVARFALCTLLTALLVALWKPNQFLSFVCERPRFWAFVMVAYPILSVIPQEIIFRSFFFQRYARIFPGKWPIIIASAVLFGAAHLIFQNYVAPLMCLIGGLFFAHTYEKTRSLALAAIEHALYGCMIFTVGLGMYFYHGAVYSTHDVTVSPACAYIGERVGALRNALF